jgi:hypothetical protein
MFYFFQENLIRSLSASIAILTSMITPALLISASGTFILSTSHRLGRVIDRVRALSDLLDSIMQDDTQLELLDERRALIFDMIDRQTARAKLLARGLTIFYLAAATFVATSVAIGIISLTTPRYAWIPLGLGILGACFLFYGSVILIFEARLAVENLRIETGFVGKLVTHHTSRKIR